MACLLQLVGDEEGRALIKTLLKELICKKITWLETVCSVCRKQYANVATCNSMFFFLTGKVIRAFAKELTTLYFLKKLEIILNRW